MSLIVKKISGNEQVFIVKIVQFLINYYRKEIGDSMEFKFQLLSSPKIEKYLIQNVSDDEETYFCLLLKDKVSYGFWLVEENAKLGKIEFSITKQFQKLELVENISFDFENLIKDAI